MEAGLVDVERIVSSEHRVDCGGGYIRVALAWTGADGTRRKRIVLFEREVQFYGWT